MEMCIQGMHWSLLYIFQGIWPHTFEKLATWAHNMELSIANHDAKDRIVDQWKERYDGKKNDKTSKKPVQEPMTINTTLIKIATWDKKKKVKEARPTRENKRHWFTLEELKEKMIIFLTLMCLACWKICSRKKLLSYLNANVQKKWVVLMI